MVVNTEVLKYSSTYILQIFDVLSRLKNLTHFSLSKSKTVIYTATIVSITSVKYFEHYLPSLTPPLSTKGVASGHNLPQTASQHPSIPQDAPRTKAAR